MGIFDYIKDFKCPCPSCGNEISEFQTKDGDVYLREVTFNSVTEFHQLCACGEWVEFNLKIKPVEDRKIEDYEMLHYNINQGGNR